MADWYVNRKDEKLKEMIREEIQKQLSEIVDEEHEKLHQGQTEHIIGAMMEKINELESKQNKIEKKPAKSK